MREDKSMTVRHILRGTAAASLELALALQLANAAPPATPIIRITLLGTGAPNSPSTRHPAGLLIEAGTEQLLFDAGPGVFNRLIDSGGALTLTCPNPAGAGAPIPCPNAGVNKLFISHLHSDHVGGIADLYSLGWFYRLANPLQVWGPGPSSNGDEATQAMMLSFHNAFENDIKIRCCLFVEQGPPFQLPLEGVEPSGHDIHPGVVYDKHGVTVTAFLVNHEPVEPAYGFRVDYAGHSVVYSGDTKPNQNLVAHSQKVDVLIHEVYGWPRADGYEVYDYHTSPEGAAGIFNATLPKMAAYTHMIIPPYEAADGSTEVARTRTAGYAGPLTAGVDLMRIDVTLSGVVIE
jgi:ribonuclease Z